MEIKDLLILFSILFIIFILVLIVRTILFKPLKQNNISLKEDVNLSKIEKEYAIDSLKEMIKCKTVSSRNESEESYDEFTKFEDVLRNKFPLVFKNCEFKKLGKKSLLFLLKGKSNENKNTVLMAHYDVVPVNEENWEKDPFAGIIENNVLWGRGTLDTKGTLNGILNAVEKLLREDFIPQNNIYLAFAGDEEVNGTGAQVIVRYFEENNINLSMVLDEGGAVVDNVFPKVTSSCAVVGIAEKGMLNVKLTVKSNGGHASIPKPNGSIAKLSKAVLKIENNPFTQVLTIPTLELFNRLGRHSSFMYRMIFANLWLFKGVLNMICKKGGGEMNALSRTTTAFTQMNGSQAINVLPPEASVCINLRLITGETQESALKRLGKIIDDKDIIITRIDGFNPTNISEINCKQFDILSNAIIDTWDNTIVTPYLMLACSDSRHYNNVSKNVYRFSAMHLSKEERALIHGNNERIPLETIVKVVEFYIRLIKKC